MRIASIIFFLLFLTSCVRLKDFPVHGEFEGIKTALDRKSCVNILIVHGMGGFSTGDPENLKQAIVNGLKLQKSGPACVREIVDGSCSPVKSYGSLKREEYCDNFSSKMVRFYTLNWSNSTIQEKRRLHHVDNLVTNTKYRLPFIQKVKKNEINNALADTILYFSDFQSEIEYPFTKSIRWIQEDSREESRQENMIVGFSMGGVLLVNALDAMLYTTSDTSNQKIAKEFIDNISAFFFMSNTYPLFEITENYSEKKHEYDDDKVCCIQSQGLNDQFDCWNWRASPVGRFIYKKRETFSDFQIVSFNDPNDLFSYYATGYYVPSDVGFLNAFLNENVRNAKTSFFGIIDPRVAHSGYGSNQKVLSLITFGLRPVMARTNCKTLKCR